MKKKLFLLPIFAMLLTSCSVEDLMFWKKKEDTPQQEQKEDPKPGDDDTPGGDTTVHVTSVSLGKTTLSLEEMKREQLTYTVLPSNATNKNVEWSTSDGSVASVVDGLVYANNPGTATITITTEDGNKTATCDVTVTQKIPETKTVTKTIVFNELGLTDREDHFTYVLNIDDNTTLQFKTGTASFDPRCYDGSVGKGEYEARVYPGHQFTIKNLVDPLLKVEIIFSTKGDGSNPITADVGTYDAGTWTGSSNEINFSVGGNDGHRRISSIKVTYEGELDPDEEINLGVKTISEVKDYINSHPMSKTSFGNWTNDKVNVTIKGFAIAKIDMVKTAKTYGDDVSKRGRVIMADSTGFIGAASDVSGQGTSLWGKVGSYQCGPKSKYIVSGYISFFRGNPEIYVNSFSYDESLNITWNAKELSSGVISLTQFYTNACNVDYNCAGHGYGAIYTFNSVKCHESNSTSQTTDLYKVTDGTKNLNINAYNISTKMSAGSMYNVTGIISLKNYSPIIIALSIEKVEEEAFTFDYKAQATEITIENLRKITGQQDDTMNRYPDVVSNFGTIYKTRGYLNAITQDELYYVGIGDTYNSKQDIIGKDNASTTYGLALIHNDDYWAAEASEIQKYNETYKQGYIWEDKPIDIYYVVYQIRYVSGKTIWEIYLLNDFLADLAKESV